MNDEQLNESLKDLQAELNITPSPEFAAKVRERIEEAPTPSRWNAWAWTGVAAACAVAVIAVAEWRGGPASTGDASPESVTATVPAATVITPTLTPSVPGAPSDGPTARPGASAPAPRTGAPVIVAAATTRELEVLVPPDQLMGIRRLMAAVRGGARPNLPASPALIDPDTGELITPKPLDIPLITVDPLPGSPDGRSGGRENR